MARIKKNLGKLKQLVSVVDRMASSSSASSKVRRRRPNGGSRMQTQGSTVPLLSGSLPKPFLRLTRSDFKGGIADTTYHMSGCEVIGEVRTATRLMARINQGLNPNNGALFPRLSAVALAFERYRFLKVMLKYHTGSPATRSGALGLLIDFDNDDLPPNSMVEIAANEAGAIGSIARDLQVVGVWPKDDPFFLMTPSDSVSTESQWRYPARVYCSVDASQTADDDLLAGWVSIHYDVELLRLKAPSLTVLGGSLVDKVATDVESTFDWAVDNAVGWWDWFNSRDVVDGATTTPAYNETCALPPGSWDLSWLMDLGAATVSGLDEKVGDDYFCIRRLSDLSLRGRLDTAVRRPSLPGSSISCSTSRSWENPAVVHRRRRMRSKKRTKERPIGPVMGLLDAPEPLIPMAANDVTVKWKAYYDLAGNYVTLFTDVINVAGAGTISRVHNLGVELPDGVLHPYVTIVLPTGEERIIDFGRVGIVPESLIE